MAKANERCFAMVSSCRGGAANNRGTIYRKVGECWLTGH